MRCLLSVFLLLATPSFAESEAACEELWFARNAMMDGAGYCFSTPLGQAVFDNSDCATTEPVLSGPANRIIARILEVEADLACAIDTSLTAFQALDLQDGRLHLEQRRELAIQPPAPADVIDAFSCHDYRGEPLPVLAAPDRNAPLIRTVQPGGQFSFSHGVDLQDGTLTPISAYLGSGTAFADSHVWTYGAVRDADRQQGWSVGWMLVPLAGFFMPADLGGVCGYMAG